MLLISVVLVICVLHRKLTVHINMLQADIKVDYIGNVNNTESAENMVEISSTFGHVYQFLLFSDRDWGMP